MISLIFSLLLMGLNYLSIQSFVMSYFKHDNLQNYSYSYAQDSSQSETEYLKLKLIETHSKLIKQLEYSKQLEESAKDWEHRYNSTMAENESLVKKMNALAMKAQKDRMNNEKVKQLELNLVESQKKNDLLRIDLESMRTKILQLVTIKQTVEDQRRQHDQIVSKLNDKISQANRQIKSRDSLVEETRQQLERYRGKYQKQISINKQIEMQVSDLKKQNHDLRRNTQDLESSIRQERDKQSKNMNELLLIQKQIKQWKNKAQGLMEELAKVKEENHSIKTRSKQQERNLTSQLQRLTNDYNNLQALYRQKENQLQSARRKPLEDANRKKNKLEQTKQMVEKLEKEEKIKMAERMSPSPRRQQKAYSRSYKQEKQEYLTMIESVGSMQSQMLACNVERKRILSQIDKIDQTRVKNKEMISRRRRLQVQLQNQQKKLEHIRNQLKKMKVM